MKTTLDELQAFVAVVDAGSITAAARAREQTISGVSRALARLEEKLQTTLLRRTTRNLALTEEGHLFLGQARAILAAVEAAEDRMAILRAGPSGRLRVDAATPFMLHVLVPRIAGFRLAYPQIALELGSHDRDIDLLEQRTDVAIRIGVLKDSTLHARHLDDSRIRILAAPAYLERHGAPMAVDALSRHVLLGFAGLPHLNRWPVRDGAGAQLEITPTIAASSGETVRQLALAGNGITCLSDFMTAADRRAGTLVELFADRAMPIHQPIHAVYYRNSGVASRIQVFLDHLGRSLRERPF